MVFFEPTDSEKEDLKPPLEIPATALSEEALRGVIDNFIQREGTDYGMAEVSYDSKISQVERQISKGSVKIVYDPNIESVSLMTDLEWRKVSKPARQNADDNSENNSDN